MNDKQIGALGTLIGVLIGITIRLGFWLLVTIAVWKYING